MQCYPTQFARAGQFQGGFGETAAGTELVFSTANGLQVVANNGQPIGRWPSTGQTRVTC